MRILAIDTCFRAGGVAALQDGALLTSVFSTSDSPYSSRLFKDLAGLSKLTGFTVSDFDAFAVGSGPGSFTGVRAGLTAAKAWSEICGKPVVEVSSLEAVAIQKEPSSDAPSASVRSPHGQEVVCSVIDAHRGQVFGGIYRYGGLGRLDRLFEGVLTLSELIGEVRALSEGGPARFVTPTPDVFGPALTDSGLDGSSVFAASAELAPWVGRIAFEKLKRGEHRDALAVDANYIRRCDAEIYWKETA